MILPIPLDLALNTALLVNFGVTALLVAFAIFAKNFKLGRVVGLLLVTVYVGYLTSAVMAGG